MTTVKIGGRRTVAAVGLERVVRIDTHRSRSVRLGLRTDLEGGIRHSNVGDGDRVCIDWGHGSGGDERRSGEESKDGELHRWSLTRTKIRTCRE